MHWLRQIFQPHQFVNEDYIDLYHVYDNLSRTPFHHGIGIECEDPNEYIMNPWHVITPIAMKRHLDWKNRIRTQFVSFYDNRAAALQEQQRRSGQRVVKDVGYRDPNSVRIAHVHIPRDTHLWVFSRTEMLNMMGVFGDAARLDMLKVSGANEWLVWGVVPEELVVNRSEL